MPDTSDRAPATQPGSAGEVFLAFLKLGLSAFGGPVAHIGYFRTEFVERRRWLDDTAYADTVALCQFLPGPASSQVGLALGARRAGPVGAVAAWLGFTLPSAILMILAGLGAVAFGTGDPATAAAIHGLKLVAVAVVAQAVHQMASRLAADPTHASILVAGATTALVLPGLSGQLGAIALGGVAGLLVGRRRGAAAATGGPASAAGVPVSVGLALLAIMAALLAAPLVFAVPEGLRMAEAAFRAGSLVFGGGHVVLPLLEADTVKTGLVARDTFLAGYGLAQAVPGPLFTFAAFLGTAAPAPGGPLGGALGGALALVGIFLPSALILFGALPFWDRLRAWAPARAGLDGINAAVVGLLVAVLYDPVASAAIAGPRDVAAVLVAYLLLEVWKAPPWMVVIGYGLAGAAIGAWA
ncbi:chromate transporter [Thalassobaculum fulvum]|uniref:Chromate transporter n=1 Tax=Thalassobaculum fulvum TaxID=1633335 RepID=A0A918XV44_9PROT|nr:chromate efflux transporter [Thalassobaculum fulvum]GHD58588.1 chromate transporter [Thalassobaculum fulvum]